MKNKKILYLGGLILLIVLIVLSIILLNKKDNNKIDNSKTLVEAALKNINKDSKEVYYKKFTGGEILNENTCFNRYAFISNNAIYIFNPQKLKTGELSYKKVYDIPSNINVINITPSWGSDIKFFDNNDTLYTLHDENIDNKVVDSYDMYEKATYKLSDSLKWTYSTEYLGKKIDYDFMSEYDFAVTKGIFSEMFSAEGTRLNSRLRKENKLKESDFISNNNKYTIDDVIVEKAYIALKMWHKSHSDIYDMTIDPLTAPKAISDESMKEFYDCAMKLKKIDLMVFKHVLEKLKENPDIDIEEYIILSPCPLAAYTLFTYGFINKSTYIAATKKMY